MKTLKDELAKVLNAKDESSAADSFQKFCQRYAGSLPLPGEDSQFDQMMWAASEHTALSAKDEKILKRVTGRMLGEEQVDIIGAGVLKLKDLIGQSKETAINTWQDMLAAMSWQQMVPAGALRGVGTQMVSLGTFQKQLDAANVQVNIGWLVDKENLRVLLQAKDAHEQAMPDVELRIKEESRGVVFSRKTNEDGAVVAPQVHVGPGKYQIVIICGDQEAETPYFVV
jgi:hypothetical protein